MVRYPGKTGFSAGSHPNISLQGTRGTDRLQVIVTLRSGETYTVVDQLLLYRYGDKIRFFGSIEIIFLTFLGIFPVPIREGQTEEDIREDIFELHCPRHFGIPPCDIWEKSIQHGMLILEVGQGFLQSHFSNVSLGHTLQLIQSRIVFLFVDLFLLIFRLTRFTASVACDGGFCSYFP